jgi:hypothetical protein
MQSVLTGDPHGEPHAGASALRMREHTWERERTTAGFQRRLLLGFEHGSSWRNPARLVRNAAVRGAAECWSAERQTKKPTGTHAPLRWVAQPRRMKTWKERRRKTWWPPF